jgi:hypothetical protein
VKLKNMLAGMEYCGEVNAPKRHYTVFRNKVGYVLCSQKTYSLWEGDFVIVKGKAVEYLARRLKGQTGLTSTLIRDRTRTAQFARERFDVLNGMYVLMALGRAKIDTRFKRRAIHFNVKG